MSFLSLIAKNILRQRMRAGLTVLGIGVGITTVIALGIITAGLKRSAEGLITSGGSHFMVAQKGAADLTFSTITEDELAAVAQRPDVDRATGILIHYSRVGPIAYFGSFGIRPEDIGPHEVPLREGRGLAPGADDEIVLGRTAAESFHAAVGDTVDVDSASLRVVGIYSTGSTFQDNGDYLPLETVQRMTQKPDTVTAIFVEAKAGLEPRSVARAIERDHPRLTAITQLSEYSEVDQGLQFLDAGNLAISLLAVGIGAIGVMNTMVMSVFERTREIGILRAVGWSSSRVLRMIIGESLLLCGIAAAFGSLLGVLAAQLVMLAPTVGAFLEPVHPPAVFARGLIVAVVVALGGAAYPAYRALRLTPMEALRHE